MPPATAAKTKPSKPATAPILTMSAAGYPIVHRRGSVKAMKAACDGAIARMKADTRKGDAVAFLHDVRRSRG